MDVRVCTILALYTTGMRPGERSTTDLAFRPVWRESLTIQSNKYASSSPPRVSLMQVHVLSYTDTPSLAWVSSVN
jgi:hypothetical protein